MNRDDPLMGLELAPYFKAALEDERGFMAEYYAQNLKPFVQDFFPVLEPMVPYVDNWHIDCICEHLQAVTKGEIRNIIFNIPPRHMKSLLISVMWNAWEWITKPSLRYLHASYAEDLSVRDSGKTIFLIQSPLYQFYFADRFKLVTTSVKEFKNDRMGSRRASSVDGGNTGHGGERIVIDDPHNVRDVESAVKRPSVLSWHDQVMSSRKNNPKTDVEVVIMQRSHAKDLTGHLIEKDGRFEEGGKWVHVMLPARFERSRCYSSKWFSDIRKEEGELLYPGRFDEEVLSEMEKRLGSYGTAGQLQQRPDPAGGGVLSLEWFKRFDRQPAVVKNITMSVDTANKAKNLSAYNVFQIWAEDNEGRDCLIHQERFRSEFPELRKTAVLLFLRWRPQWVLIEDKASGTQLLQDLSDKNTLEYLFKTLNAGPSRRMPLVPIEPEGDKVNRMAFESPHIEAGNCALPIHAPWLVTFESTIRTFPSCEYMDEIDAMSQYLHWKRNRHSRTMGLATVVGA